MTSRLKSEIFQIYDAYRSTNEYDDTTTSLAFVHAVSEFYGDAITPVGGEYEAQDGHWWLEAKGENIDVFSPDFGDYSDYQERVRGSEKLFNAINEQPNADQIFDLSADILSFIVACPEETLANDEVVESYINEALAFDDDDLDYDEDITAAAVCRM